MRGPPPCCSSCVDPLQWASLPSPEAWSRTSLLGVPAVRQGAWRLPVGLGCSQGATRVLCRSSHCRRSRCTWSGWMIYCQPHWVPGLEVRPSSGYFGGFGRAFKLSKVGHQLEPTHHCRCVWCMYAVCVSVTMDVCTCARGGGDVFRCVGGTTNGWEPRRSTRLCFLFFFCAERLQTPMGTGVTSGTPVPWTRGTSAELPCWSV